jgi:DNA processing protein
MNIRRFLLAIHLMDFINVEQELTIFYYLSKLDEISLPLNYTLFENILNTELFFKEEYEIALLKAEVFTGDFLTIMDEEYPEQLLEIPKPPVVLFFKGDLRLLKLPSLTVVGTRLVSEYGATAIEKLLPDLIEQDIAITSGLARGVDAISHQVTLSHKGFAIAVVGTGLGHSYPAVNSGLQRAIARDGLLLSEYNYEVGPRKWHFPARNRILAGLSSATLVIEAKKRSGSLITARMAVDYNRNLLALPGNLGQLNSQGVNDLIAQGAKIINDSKDIISEVYRFD